MDQSTIINIVKQYAEEVVKVFNPDKIYLYGSYAKGTARDESDIDIAVVFNEYNGDYLESLKLLYKLTRGIDFRIEPIILEEKNDPSGFLNDIKNNGILID